MTHTCIIIWIIIIAGLLGGLTNYYSLVDHKTDSKECWILFFKTILLSLCASITVPLFLQVISNNLLDEATKGNNYPSKNYFILAGFCVLASFYSKRFLEDLYDRVKKIEQQANIAEKKVEQLENNTQEIDTFETVNEVKQTTSATNPKFKEEQVVSVINSILNSKYTFRTLTGIVADTNPKLNKEEVLEILTLLKSAGFADTKKGKKGTELWRIVNPDV